MTSYLPRARRPSAAGLLVGTSLLLILAVAAAASHHGSSKLAGLALGATVIVLWVQLWWSWRALITLLLAVIWFIPIKRYGFPFHLPFDVEPYRILVAFLVLVWIAALLLDRRVKLHRGKIEFSVLGFLFVTLLSIATNFRYIEAQNLEIPVLKTFSFFLSFVLVYFMIVSITRTRNDLEVFVKLIVAGGAIVGGSGIIEYRTRYNVFDHLSQIFPFLQFSGPLNTLALDRDGSLRVYGPAQHPIAYSAALIVVLPLGVYLARSSGRAVWWFAVFLIGMGAAAALSRTGVTMFVASLLVFWRCRPVDTRRLLPWFLLSGVVVFLALPHALGTLSHSLFPTGGLIAQQHAVGNHRRRPQTRSARDTRTRSASVGEAPGNRYWIWKPHHERRRPDRRECQYSGRPVAGPVAGDRRRRGCRARLALLPEHAPTRTNRPPGRPRRPPRGRPCRLARRVRHRDADVRRVLVHTGDVPLLHPPRLRHVAAQVRQRTPGGLDRLCLVVARLCACSYASRSASSDRLQLKSFIARSRPAPPSALSELDRPEGHRSHPRMTLCHLEPRRRLRPPQFGASRGGRMRQSADPRTCTRRP